MRSPFPTLCCYPLTGAIESEAETLEDILLELLNAEFRTPGTKIDTDSAAAWKEETGRIFQD